MLAALWEAAARLAGNDLLLPTFTQTARAFAEGIASGDLLNKARLSLVLLLQGYALGVLAAFGLTVLAVSTQFGRDLLATLTAMFNPLPAIALLPLALPLPCKSRWTFLSRSSTVRNGTTTPDQAHLSSS